MDPGFEPLTLRQSQFADWTPADTGLHEEIVEAYSNCENVDVILNGRSLGTKPGQPDDSPRIWKVAWEPGTIKAIGRNRGGVAAEHELRTAGKPSKILLVADRAGIAPSWDDVAFVTAMIADQNGIEIPAASDPISFEIKGPGILAAVNSGGNANVDSFQTSARRGRIGDDALRCSRPKPKAP